MRTKVLFATVAVGTLLVIVAFTGFRTSAEGDEVNKRGLVIGELSPAREKVYGMIKATMSEVNQKISSGVTLQKINTQIMEMNHLDQRYRGVEYQIYVQLPDEISTEEILKRIQIEVAFSGKAQELMNVERMKRPLQLFKDESGSNTYIVRVPSIYKAEYTEDELNYLMDQHNEVRMDLYLDEERIRDLI